jgi:hypothetical protein
MITYIAIIVLCLAALGLYQSVSQRMAHRRLEEDRRKRRFYQALT